MRILGRLFRNQKGFTLIELIVATAILGILAELIATVIVNQMPRYRLNSATRQVTWDLMSARMKAVSDFSNLKVIFPNDHEYTVWSDSNSDNIVDNGETIVLTSDVRIKYPDVSFADPLPIPFVFTIRGNSSMAQQVTLTNSMESRRIRVSVAGKISVID
jgi:prepilin-type N-terminal cleavage/methylation domain-containing protein